MVSSNIADKQRQKSSIRDENIRRQAETLLIKQNQATSKSFSPFRRKSNDPSNEANGSPGSKNKGKEEESKIKKSNHNNQVDKLDLDKVEIINENQYGIEAAKIMAAHRLDCLLVNNSQNEITGIVTDKDLAFKIVGLGKDSSKIRIKEIMTPNPLVIPQDFTIDDALELMIEHDFRHLPVMKSYNDNHDSSNSHDNSSPLTCIGMLDIAKCVMNAIKKMEKAKEATNQLSLALDNINQIYSSPSNEQKNLQDMMTVANHFKGKLSGPSVGALLSTLPYRMEEESESESLPSLNSNSPSPSSNLTVNFVAKNLYGNAKKFTLKSTVTQVIKEIAAINMTAALIVDEDDHLVGIFTTKDLVLRTMAAGLDPDTTAIVRVMTPHPDIIDSESSLLDALRQMSNGHYLHLPVSVIEGKNSVKTLASIMIAGSGIEDTNNLNNNFNRIIGIVDILQVTFAILDQIKNSFNLNGNYNPTIWTGEMEEKEEMEGSISKQDEYSGSRRRGKNIAANTAANVTNTTISNNNLDTISNKSFDDNQITFKIKYDNQVILIQTESLVTIRESIFQAFKIQIQNNENEYILNYEDEEKDQIEIKNQSDLIGIIKMNKISFKYRINILIKKRKEIGIMENGIINRNNEFIGLSKLTLGVGAIVILMGIAIGCMKYKK